jgi:hypothetical protein
MQGRQCLSRFSSCLRLQADAFGMPISDGIRLFETISGVLTPLEDVAIQCTREDSQRQMRA